MGLFRKAKVYTSSDDCSAESRQAFARRKAGQDTPLLTRMSGRNGQAAVVEGSLGENSGSARFRIMQAEAAQRGGKAGKFTKADGNNGVW